MLHNSSINVDSLFKNPHNSQVGLVPPYAEAQNFVRMYFIVIAKWVIMWKIFASPTGYIMLTYSLG